MRKGLAVLRSTVFLLLQILLTVIFALLALCTVVLPAHGRYAVISQWSRIMVVLARVVCGIRYEVRGREHLPSDPCIVLCKHQSAWETMALQALLPPQVWVLKRSLLRIPFFGWGLAMMNPIAIDRTAGRAALKQTVTQGRERLAQGFWIIIFPEGTRVAPGHRGKYHPGGAWLAVQTGVPVVPIAHNAGGVWGRNAFLKQPGCVTVSIGPALNPVGLRAEELLARVEQWIEEEVAVLGDPRWG